MKSGWALCAASTVILHVPNNITSGSTSDLMASRNCLIKTKSYTLDQTRQHTPR